MGIAVQPSFALSREAGWIYSRNWDLTFLIFSAVLVPLPFACAWLAERVAGMPPARAIELVNIAVAGLIGGPHLFSTFTLTLLNRPFLRRHPYYAVSAAAIPFAVVYFGLYHYALLIQVFFAWASLHVLHQIIYITDCYRVRRNPLDPWVSRAIDYGVLLTGLYPLGLYKIAAGEFRVGGVVLAYPAWARGLHLPEAAGAVFAAFLLAWIVKTAQEWRAGTMSAPKTMLIAITTVVSVLLPLGSNLDVLFQGYNTLHSFQYLFLFWLLNRLRYLRGEIESPLVKAAVRSASVAPYYLCFLAATGVLVGVSLMVRESFGLPADQSYFIVVLSVLLVHYYYDHYLFTGTELVRE
jgi:hypothetical protein